MIYPFPDRPAAQATGGPLQPAAVPVDSTRPTTGFPHGNKPWPNAKDAQATEPLPSDPNYFACALVRHGELLDNMGVPQDQREPYLRDLSALAGIALDAYFNQTDSNEADFSEAGEPFAAQAPD